MRRGTTVVEAPDAGGACECSQSVRGAYKAATGLDLERSGPGVCPGDITDSKLTDTYKKL